MKKIIAIAIILLLVVFIGGPYYSGKVAETETHKLIDNMNLSSAEYGSTDVVLYERGARSTQAKYRYTPPAALAPLFGKADTIDYSCDSTHGITGIDYTCRFDGESEYSKFVTEELDGNDPLSIYGTVSAFGGFTQTISLKAIKDLEVDGETINLPKADITVATDSSMQRFDINGGSDAFSIASKGESLSVGKMSIGGDLNRIEDKLFTGDVKLNLSDFSVKSKSGDSSFKDLSVVTNTRADGENLDSDFVLSIAQANVPDGQVKNIEDAVISFTANGIDIDAMIEYQALMAQIQRDMLASAESEQAPEMDPMQMAVLLPIVERMMKQGLEITAKAQAKLDGEANNVSFDLKLLESMTMAQLPAFMTQPDEALKKIDVKLTAALDKKLVDSQPMVASMISQSPLVDGATDNYKVDLKLGEKIELNGKAMKFQELQYLVLSSLPM